MAKNGATWKKGQSGNPAGKAKSHPEVRAQIAQGLEKVVPKLIKWVASNDDEKAKFAMAKLLEFGMAKPAPTIGNENLEKLQRIAEALKG